MKKELNYRSEKGNVELTVTEDRFSAYLKINENGIISENEIIELINKAGIKGLLNHRDQEDSEKKYSEPFLIARSVYYNELNINYLFDVKHSYDPKIIKSVTDFNKLSKVTENNALAEIKLNKIDKDEQYYDVFGEAVSDADVIERFASRFLTDQVYFSKQRGAIFSLVKGYPYLEASGAIALKAVFESSENLHKLKMNFYGDLIINGNIDNCQLYVTGDLIVHGNITNCLSDWIMAKGKLEFDSAENSIIGAGKGITFSKSSRYCYTVCDGIIKGGVQSSVIGGLMKSSSGIQIASVGSTIPIKTSLEIAILPYQKEQLKKVAGNLTKIRKKNKAEFIGRAEKQKKLESILVKAYDQLLQIKKSPSIKVEQKLYKDTWIKIYNNRKGIFKETSGGEFSFDAQGIRINLG